MTQNIPLNPMELWSRALTEWETSMNSLANQGMKSEPFNQAVQKASTVALEARRQVEQANTKLLTAMNLPSREQIEQLDDRLARIEDMLRLLLETSGVAPGVAAALPDEARPRRTRQPRAPGVAVPDAAVPDAAVPDAAVPDAAAPDAAAPDAAVPRAAVPERAPPKAPPGRARRAAR